MYMALLTINLVCITRFGGIGNKVKTELLNSFLYDQLTIKVCAFKYVPNNFDPCLLYICFFFFLPKLYIYVLLLLLYVRSIIYLFGWRCQLKILACSFATIIPFNPQICEYAKCLPHSLNQKLKVKESVPHSKFLSVKKEKVIII